MDDKFQKRKTMLSKMELRTFNAFVNKGITKDFIFPQSSLESKEESKIRRKKIQFGLREYLIKPIKH